MAHLQNRHQHSLKPSYSRYHQYHQYVCNKHTSQLTDIRQIWLSHGRTQTSAAILNSITHLVFFKTLRSTSRLHQKVSPHSHTLCICTTSMDIYVELYRYLSPHRFLFLSGHHWTGHQGICVVQTSVTSSISMNINYCVFWFDIISWKRHLERCQTSVWRNWSAAVLWHLIFRSSFRMSAALWWASSTSVDREDHGWGIDDGPIHHGPSCPGVAKRFGHLRWDVWRPHREVITESPSYVQGSHLDPHREGRVRSTAIIDWISSGRCTDGDRHQEASIDSRTSAASVAPSEVHPASFARCDRQHLDAIGQSTYDIHTWRLLSHRSQTIRVEHRKWHQERSSQLLVEAWHWSLHPGHQRCIPLRSWRTIGYEDLQHQGEHLQGHLRESWLAAWHLVGLSRPISCQLSGNRGITQALCGINQRCCISCWFDDHAIITTRRL